MKRCSSWHLLGALAVALCLTACEETPLRPVTLRVDPALLEPVRPPWQTEIDFTLFEREYAAECNNRRDERRATIEGNLGGPPDC